MVSSLVAACHSKACAPPPTGSGGSNASGSAGGASGAGGGLGSVSWSTLQEEVSILRDFPREQMKNPSHAKAVFAENNRRVKSGELEGVHHKPITVADARGDSEGVSAVEFQKMASQGKARIDQMTENSSPTKGLDEKWDQVKSDSYDSVQESWGGATIDAHTGVALPSKMDTDTWALTIKGEGVSTVSVPEGASREKFDAAMDQAKTQFSDVLEREGSHLGVFRDDALGRIDIDPVLVTTQLSDVHTIGAATHAIGGAYNFKDGDGYWPPHVREGA